MFNKIGPSSNKTSSNSGAAMVLVLCVMAVFVALAMTILLSASVLTANASREVINKRCQIAAVSLSEVLDNEIVGTGHVTDEDVDTFYEYIRSRIDLNYGANSKWSYYCEASPLHSKLETSIHRYMFDQATINDNEKLKELSKKYKIMVEMYWELNEDTMYLYENDSSIYKYRGSQLVVRSQCSNKKESYTVTSIYQLNVENISEESTVTNYAETDGGDTWKNSNWVWTQTWKE